MLMLWLLAVTGLVAARSHLTEDEPWRCPEITQPPAVSCSCDLPHTLRCTGNSLSALHVIAQTLRGLTPPAAVSLLDCTVQDVTALPEPLLEGVILHGLVVSSGEIRHVSERAFSKLAGPLQALGLPNNKLAAVPTAALSALPGLDRLDLSHNHLQSLTAKSFKGLRNLTFLELSDNQLSHLEPNSFLSMPKLETLRLRGNKLGVRMVSALQGMAALQELDVSNTSLVGPVGSQTLTALPLLRVLQLSRNQLSSVRRGALQGFSSLVSLSLRHNQIDVLEDNAFSELPTLTQLDLGHNRIVAVSGSSLAHLSRLVQLDLAHNFLRALTADLVVPLQSLEELRLDDNDISIVTSDALRPNSTLRRLTLADNPLNCDCSLAEFAAWLTNTSLVTTSDRATAVCATPPALENGLLVEVGPSQLLCGEDDEDLAPPEGPLSSHMPVSRAKVTLRALHYDGHGVTLTWSVEASAAPYKCDTLFVYEEVDVHEVLLESDPLTCNFSELADPQVLHVTIPSDGLFLGRRYRYCVVLLEGGGDKNDVMTLVLGCSDILPLKLSPQPQIQPQLPWRQTTTSIVTLQANVTAPGTMAVTVQMWDSQPLQPYCRLTVAVFVDNTMVAQQQFNCSIPSVVLRKLPLGPYRVCATIEEFPSTGPHAKCITVQQTRSSGGVGGLNNALVAGFVALSTMLLLGLYLAMRHFFSRPKTLPTHQCFLAGPPDEQQHSRYVKLHATTKL